MAERKIFEDSSGRRWFYARVLAAILGGAALVIFGGTLLGTVISADLPAASPVPDSIPVVTQYLIDEADASSLGTVEAERIADSPAAPARLSAFQQLSLIRSVFTVQEDPRSVESLRAHLSQLDVVFPDWLSFANADGRIDVSVDPRTSELLRSAGKFVLPRIANTNARGEWYTNGLTVLFSDANATNKFIDQVISIIQRVHADGINLDIEGVSVDDEQVFTDFLRKVADALHSRGLIVTVDVPMGVDGYDLKTISAISDAVVLMAYDEHFQTGRPGPIASQNWFDDGLEDTLVRIPRSKLIVGIGAYGYDWSEDKSTAEPVGFYDAVRLAERAGTQIETDPATMNSRFVYQDENKKHHEVWLLDAVSAWNEVVTVRRSGARGLALWRVGLEEPAVWSLFGTGAAPAFDRGALEIIPAPPEAGFRGNGALLRVVGQANAGARTVERDGDSIAWAEISALPTGFQVERPWLQPGKKIALTFDDGPDPVWTPEFLRVLARYNIPATFFVVGDQAERNPQIVQAEFTAGHLLGNHTYLHPDLNQISDLRLRLELNATQRVIQALTGHSTVLFRAPYDAHAEPLLATELGELGEATQLGYLIAGTDIDSEDYDAIPRDHIVQNVMTRLQSNTHVVVFHDGGGNRGETVAALDKLIPALLAQGYQFVGIDDLLDVDKSQLMPQIAGPERFFAFARRIFVGFRMWGIEILLAVFFVTTAMSIVRLLVLAGLIVRGKFDASVPRAASFAPDVRVLIPAHNEAKVIARTLQAVLESDYPKFGVTVIDDGSTDDTGRIVREWASADHRVTLITQPHCRGKALALNRGFNEANEDFVITIDADTIIFPHTVRELIEPFSDPTVDAVCGNVHVGNLRNVLTKFQHVEYVTSQNYERRAFDALNCISVVPGATGAWNRRKVVEAGGYSPETLTEDTDLTLTLLGRGGRIVYAPLAHSVTEAPERVSALFRQRYRWSFGTLQCLWKHKDRFGRGMLGWMMLPYILVFQFLFAVLAPLGDIVLIKCLLWHELMPAAVTYLAFLGLDFVSPVIAFRLDRQSLKHTSVVIAQRFFYRQFMYVVTFAVLFGALRGQRFGWNKLRRMGTCLSPAVPVASARLS